MYAYETEYLLHMLEKDSCPGYCHTWQGFFCEENTVLCLSQEVLCKHGRWNNNSQSEDRVPLAFNTNPYVDKGWKIIYQI
jgi:hypothetical protein